ncbi:hypothetical protein [Aquisalimonas asiatica]|uniref:Uncharacterized protein n=1 Tax=Aquisalimonas asiatica TaxID=406100 RepID=A0A1H8VXP1_9GAMM|nr:hypothetical protein [Aquisalimonas asiatica]SEP20222.1 hypothetical protein SAMN04488052_1231 [Aquisalimonas asiatica]
MAFYSWYMDRSKPLPPDEVFDPYRERDEERRLREYGPEVVRQFPASLTGPGTRLVTRMGMAGFR